jgi:hypothetical protein
MQQFQENEGINMLDNQIINFKKALLARGS